jgi:hypothetical protein
LKIVEPEGSEHFEKAEKVADTTEEKDEIMSDIPNDVLA